MSDMELLLLGIGGLAVFYLFRTKKNNSEVPVISQTVIEHPQTSSVKNTSLSKVGGNPINEEQPVISTNNAQQPPTLIETSHK